MSDGHVAFLYKLKLHGDSTVGCRFRFSYILTRVDTLSTIRARSQYLSTFQFSPPPGRRRRAEEYCDLTLHQPLTLGFTNINLSTLITYHPQVPACSFTGKGRRIWIVSQPPKKESYLKLVSICGPTLQDMTRIPRMGVSTSWPF